MTTVWLGFKTFPATKCLHKQEQKKLRKNHKESVYMIISEIKAKTSLLSTKQIRKEEISLIKMMII